jgi:hypothetical protein
VASIIAGGLLLVVFETVAKRGAQAGTVAKLALGISKRLVDPTVPLIPNIAGRKKAAAGAGGAASSLPNLRAPHKGGGSSRTLPPGWYDLNRKPAAGLVWDKKRKQWVVPKGTV